MLSHFFLSINLQNHSWLNIEGSNDEKKIQRRFKIILGFIRYNNIIIILLHKPNDRDDQSTNSL